MPRQPNPTMEAAVAILSKNNAADFQTVKAKLAAKGLNIIPIVYGRAKAMLGLGKPAGTPTPRRARPADALQAAQTRRARAAAPIASNGASEDLPERLGALIAERDALNARITAASDAINAG